MAYRIAVDGMGGDRAPKDVIEGIRLFREKDQETEVLLVGQQETLEPLSEGLDVTLIHAPSVVTMHDSPSTALKARKDSSVAVSVQLVKEKRADAVISMGNSGATVAFAMFILGRIGDVSRPGIVCPMPHLNGETLLLDAGATVDCKPEHLLHFALLGSVYSHAVFKKEKPRVGLLSIGEEKSKGNELTFETYKLLESAPINFIGNVEGVDIMRDTADVVVCDGFIGNVILKFGEGLSAMFAQTLQDETEHVLSQDENRKHGGELLRETMSRVDYTRYGGAALLGVQGHCLIGHGRSGSRAIANGIHSARKQAEFCKIEEFLQLLEASTVAVS